MFGKMDNLLTRQNGKFPDGSENTGYLLLKKEKMINNPQGL
jgi:hypothetical protein